ncbi:MAG: hypothetical protein ACJ70S_03220 [Nitrososphaera sp.]
MNIFKTIRKTILVAARTFGSSKYVPTTIMPLNGASIRVAFLSKTAITIPAPLKVVGS